MLKTSPCLNMACMPAADETEESSRSSPIGDLAKVFEVGDRVPVQGVEYTIESKLGQGGQAMVFGAQGKDGLKVSWVSGCFVGICDFCVNVCRGYLSGF